MEQRHVLRVQCRCGQVQMVASSDPIATIRCYCSSCRRASLALSQRPGAASALEFDGGTDYVLYRKDRVRCAVGEELLAEHRLLAGSPTRRVIATCCNTPVFLDFTRGNWLSVYRVSVEPAHRPAVSMGVMARDQPAAPGTAPTWPVHPGFPPRLFWKVVLSWVAMGFRRPRIDCGSKRVLS